MSDNTGSGYLTVYFKELYMIIQDFCLVLRNLYTIYTLNLTNNYICLVLRKFYSGFMFYLVLRNYRPKFYNSFKDTLIHKDI